MHKTNSKKLIQLLFFALTYLGFSSSALSHTHVHYHLYQGDKIQINKTKSTDTLVKIEAQALRLPAKIKITQQGKLIAQVILSDQLETYKLPLKIKNEFDESILIESNGAYIKKINTGVVDDQPTDADLSLKTPSFHTASM
ncbi:MAG: hypothetical protein QF441_10860 [Bacteriovoracaceae bacterium]|jgi:hypothetical protein|nr:hypothetical protein [Bacteriovoracaceae bacterium]